MAIITGRLQNSDLTPYLGSVRFQLNNLGVDPTVLVLPNEVKVDSNGSFSIDLWPNTLSLQATYYQCTLDNGTTFNISIPGEKSNYTLTEVILLDFGKLETSLSQIVQGNLVRIAELQNYTGIENGLIPLAALKSVYPDTTVGKSLRVDQPLTIGDGLSGGEFRGDTPITITVNDTVIRDTDNRLTNAREWTAPTASVEVVSQPNNTTRFAWTPQRIWDTIKSWFSTINSDDLLEGTNNLYYNEDRVSSNPDVKANTDKVSADKSVTTHNDMTDAGSGEIITFEERTKLSMLDPNAEPNSVTSVSGKTGNVQISKSDVGLSNVLNIDTSDATNITSGTLDGSRLLYGTVPGTPAQGNDARFSDSREWTAMTVSQEEAESGISSTRRAWTSQRVRENVSNYTQPFTEYEKTKLSGLDNSKYLPINGTALNADFLNNVSPDKFVRNDKDTDFVGKLQLKGMSGTQFSDTEGISGLNVISDGPTGASFMSFQRLGNYAVYFGLDVDNQLKVGGWSLGDKIHTIWTSGNTGAGSGLDADLWDGKQFSSYLDQALLTTSSPEFKSVYSSFWFRSIGNVGWFNETYKGGIHMYDSTWIRTYNGKSFYSTSVAQAVSHIGAGAFGCEGVRIGKGNIGMNGRIYFGSNKRQMLNLYSTLYGIGVQTSTLYFRSGSDFAFYVGGSHHDDNRRAGGGYTVWNYIKSSDNLHFYKNSVFRKTIKIENDSPTIQLKDNRNGRSIWLHNNNNRFYILSDNDKDDAWEGPYPAIWDDPSKKAYFWDKQVLTIDTGIRKDKEDTVFANTRWSDGKEVRLGSAADFRIKHDGSNTVLDNYTGNIYHRQRSHGKNVYFQAEDSTGVNRALVHMHPDSSVYLFYNGQLRLRTEPYGVRISKSITLYDPEVSFIDFNNNEKTDFNARISCTQGANRISDGSLELKANDITLKLEPSSNNGLVFIDSKSSPNLWAFSSYSDGNFYLQLRNPDKTYNANIIRFSKSDIKHFVPLTSASSKEIKDVQGKVSNGLELVNQLNPVIYNYKGQSNTEVGLIAEEVPYESHLVYGEGEDAGIDYSRLSIYLINAVQKLTKRIEDLENRV